MRLKKVSLKNFRQFHGKHEIEFSTDGIQNVTVIHGENGGGKTTLLNAFKWCFYGKTDFDTGNDNILNEHVDVIASPGDTLILNVSVDFEHDGSDYTVSRVQKYTRKPTGYDEAGGAPVSLEWIDQHGASQTSNNPQTHINQILPEKMHSYFFFNGERIEKLAYTSAVNEVRDAIRTLMGLVIVERSLDHLKRGVRAHFAGEAKKNASKELGELIAREEALLEEKAEVESDITQSRANQQAFKEEIKLLEAKLREHEKASELQAQKDTLVAQIDEIDAHLSDNLSRHSRLIGDRGFMSFIGDDAAEVSILLDECRKKGELPYKIKGQFIDDLLAENKCICGTVLEPGSAAYKSVQSYGSAGQMDGIEDAFIDTTGALKYVESERKKLFANLKDLIDERGRLRKKRDELSEKLDELENLLAGSADVDVAGMQEKIKKLEKQLKAEEREEWNLQKRLGEIVAELTEVRKEKKELEAQSGKADVAKKRLDLVDECLRVLEDLHEAMSLDTKNKLSEKVNETLGNILTKSYWAEIDDDYQLNVFKELANGESKQVYEKSTGEGQVSSLSFIGGIISLARERQASEGKYFKGGIFPLVMDSPFGALDPTYRELVAKYIPELADQIVLLVSRSQWEGKVKQECEARAGKRVSLIYHAPEIKKGKTSHFARSGAEFEHTIVEEGYNG
jgi:DNA sulfur modification protein DndD